MVRKNPKSKQHAKGHNRAIIKIDFLHTADDDCRLLVTFENSLDQDQVCVCVCVCVCLSFCLSVCMILS